MDSNLGPLQQPVSTNNTHAHDLLHATTKMLIVWVLCFLMLYNSSIPQRALTSFPTHLPDLPSTLVKTPKALEQLTTTQQVPFGTGRIKNAPKRGQTITKHWKNSQREPGKTPTKQHTTPNILENGYISEKRTAKNPKKLGGTGTSLAKGRIDHHLRLGEVNS